jgi:catechol 2,3-dioxygenase-like lactoylglutathione lyase family enzyme
MPQFPVPRGGNVLTFFIVASDVGQSRRFYADVLGGEVLRDGKPSIVALANSWIIISTDGPPTGDKPTVTLEPPRDPDHISSFVNIRVAYTTWRDRGAHFLTPPAERDPELRCYMRDPDGHGRHYASPWGTGRQTCFNRVDRYRYEPPGTCRQYRANGLYG